MTPNSADDGSSLAAGEATLAPGSILDGRFKMEAELGRGGMGRVIAAHHLAMDQRVAIKLLLPGIPFSRAREERLVREARAAAKLKSEHAVRVLDVVSAGPHAPYIVMEYLQGESLSGKLLRERVLSEALGAELLIQACEAVGEGHAMAVIHRDLKPGNLFVVKHGGRDFVKLLDFGISKTADDEQGRITQSHALLGSPAYASPEQLQSAHSVGSTADLWSLGVVLYECLTGQLPFPGKSLAEVCARILAGSFILPRQHRPELSKGIERVITSCLQSEPGNRVRSAEQLVASLRDWAPSSADSCLRFLESARSQRSPAISGEHVIDIPRGATLTGAATESGPRLESNARAAAPARRALRVAAAIAGVALAIAGTLALSLHRSSSWPVAVSGSASAAAAAPSAAPSAAVLATPPEHAPSAPASASAVVRAQPPKKRRALSAPKPAASSAPWVETR